MLTSPFTSLEGQLKIVNDLHRAIRISEPRIRSKHITAILDWTFGKRMLEMAPPEGKLPRLINGFKNPQH
jgi:hypothetical protein